MRDDFDSVVADRCSAVDDVPAPADLWSRVQFKVLDRLPVQFIEEEPTMIDLDTPSHTDEHQKRTTRVLVGALLAAAAVVAVAFVAIRNGDPVSPADQPSPAVMVPVTVPVVDFPILTTTFVSPRNGFSIKHPDRVTLTPAKQMWGLAWGRSFSEQPDDGFDVVETGVAAVFKGVSGEISEDAIAYEGISIDEWFDENIAAADDMTPAGCGVPRGLQMEITIDGRSGKISECPNLIEATVVADGRLYLFTLLHDRSDARAVFETFAATIDLTPETAVDFPAMTTTFVSPTHGYSFKYHDRDGAPAPATELWDPVNQQLDDTNLESHFDAVETGMSAYFVGASTEIPDGVSIDEWVDEYVSPGGCGVPRSEQAEITIDGQSGRIAECSQIAATVVSGGRLYLFDLRHERSDARAWFEAWVATIDLTPETAAVP